MIVQARCKKTKRPNAARRPALRRQLPPRGPERNGASSSNAKKLGNLLRSGGAESGAHSAENALDRRDRLSVIADFLADQRAEIIADLAPAEQAETVGQLSCFRLRETFRPTLP